MEHIYLRILENDFLFIDSSLMEIKDTDINLNLIEYKLFFEMQSLGKQFKLKDICTSEDLFGYIEEFTPSQTL